MKSILPDILNTKDADIIISYFQKLLDIRLTSKEDLEIFFKDVSRLESAVSEEMAWRYIKMTCNTQDEEIEKSYLEFVQEIQPKIAPIEDQLNRKIVDSEFSKTFDDEEAYFIYLRALRSAVDLFREENIKIQSDLSTLASEYSAIQGKQTIDWEGETITLQRAANILLQPNRNNREKVWNLIWERRQKDVDALEDIFDQMVAKRHQIAVNAGFKNYRDYKFISLGRFDYTVDDCKEFHNSVEKFVVPIQKKVMRRRKEMMGHDLKPWDTAVDPLGREALNPFSNGNDLLEKSIRVLDRLDPFFGDCLRTMEKNSLLDLDSRIGKAPGGYNYPLAQTNMPFIFMNATSNLRDVETLLHEAGHAIHSFQMATLPLNSFKDTPSEVAELASMSMELLSMSAWDEFFTGEDLTRARTEQLEGVISTLPWIATIDAFQHWIYENPTHTREERRAYWKSLQQRFGTGMVDYTGIETALDYTWHRQLHLFEVPFYYVEYGIAQLGAIGVWKNYIDSEKEALQQYKDFMKLGYMKSIPEIYKTAGVKLDFSAEYIKELMRFLESQWEN
ncbi:MAG: M3 family oligoendopeptidase [Bacteroidia bacterium]